MTDMTPTTRAAFRAALEAGHELYWWHAAVLAELDAVGTVTTLPDGEARPAYNVPGIAGNMRGGNVPDVTRYARELIAAGLVRECPPRWDFDALWIEIAA